MSPLPRVAIECRAVTDPELRFAATGTAVTRLRVVASDRRKNANDEWEDGDQLWLSVTCFKQLAENVAESVTKGDLIIVTGRIKTDEWETREGEKRSAIVMIADVIGPSLQFRTTPHGASRAQRSSSPAADDPWASPSTDEPPF